MAVRNYSSTKINVGGGSVAKRGTDASVTSVGVDQRMDEK